MRRFNLVDGVMVEHELGMYVEYEEVVRTDIVSANTLLTQLDGIKAQIEEWYGE